MNIYNKFWKYLHHFMICFLLGTLLSSFLPAIEFWHPVDIEPYHFKFEGELESDPIWGTQEPFGNPEGLEIEQADRENEPNESREM